MRTLRSWSLACNADLQRCGTENFIVKPLAEVEEQTLARMREPVHGFVKFFDNEGDRYSFQQGDFAFITLPILRLPKWFVNTLYEVTKKPTS